jgi:hypothetical protein
MSYSSEHHRLAPVLAKTRQLDIATNPAPEALFEALSAGFNLWCTPEDHPHGWEGIPLIAGAFAKPCGFVGTVTWGWKGEQIAFLSLDTDAYDLADQRPERYGGTASNSRACTHNRPADINWAERKIRWLFEKAGIPCPPIVVE